MSLFNNLILNASTEDEKKIKKDIDTISEKDISKKIKENKLKEKKYIESVKTEAGKDIKSVKTEAKNLKYELNKEREKNQKQIENNDKMKKITATVGGTAGLTAAVLGAVYGINNNDNINIDNKPLNQEMRS